MAVPIRKGFNDILSILERVGRTVGVPVKNSTSSSSSYRCFKIFYRWFIISVIASQLICYYPFIKEHWGDIIIIGKSVVLLLITLIGLCKLFLFNYHRPQVIKFFDQIQYFRTNFISTEEELVIEEMYTERSILIIYTFLVMYLSTVVTNFSFPFILQPDDDLPLSMQLPGISKSETPFYEINIIQQFLSCLSVVVATVLIDIVFILLLQEGCLQVDIIMEKLSHIGQSTESEDFDKLFQIHLLHKETNKYIYDINKTYSLMLMLQFGASTYGISFATASVAVSLRDNIGLANTLMAFLFQILVYTWSGEQIRNRMGSVVESLYNNQWYNLQPSTRRSLMIMMSCNQRAYQLKAGGLIDLNLRTFLAIMKSAYSYYAVMQNI